MRKLFTLLLFVPLLSFAQHDNPCGATGYFQAGMTIVPMKQTFVGPHFARFEPINRESLYAGAGIDLLHTEQGMIIPTSFHLAFIPLPSDISPMIIGSFGYILTPREDLRGTMITIAGGMVVLNAVFTVGFQQIGREKGVGVHISVMF